MNTQFIQKSVSPSIFAVGAIERWIYNIINSAIIGGATAAISAGGLAGAHAVGVDVPQLNLKAIGIIFLSGALSKVLVALSQGLPQLQQESPAIQPTENQNKTQ